jgi:urease accessory protein
LMEKNMIKDAVASEELAENSPPRKRPPIPAGSKAKGSTLLARSILASFNENFSHSCARKGIHQNLSSERQSIMRNTMFHLSTIPSYMRNLMPIRHSTPLSVSLVALVVFAIMGFDSTVLAHVGNHFDGLAGGVAHPFSGLDHVLAMVAVGLWASQLDRPAYWLLPVTFLAVMATGAFLGVSGLALPWVEAAIAASVLVLGAMTAFALRPSIAVSVAMVGLFALVHGYSHGIELPVQGSAWAYGAGFILATFGLHIIGLVIGTVSDRAPARFVTRAAGTAIAAVGVLLLSSI